MSHFRIPVFRAIAAVAVALSATLALASAAGAATIGQTFNGNVLCNETTVYAQPSYTPTFAGEVTSFSMFASSADAGNLGTQQIDFLVLHPNGSPNQYVVAGHTGVVTLDPVNKVETFTPSSPIPMAPGDALGLYIASSSGIVCGSTSETGAIATGTGTSDPDVGSTVTFAGSPPFALDVSATVVSGTLDSHGLGVTFVDPALTAGQSYTVTISGTYSPWNTTFMSTPWRPYVMCGAPEASPMFPSPDVDNGRVGMDAYAIFAQPYKRGCGNHLTTPQPAHKLAFSVDGGANFFEAVPVSSDPANHTYTYTVTGDNQPLIVGLIDTNYSDNYGVLHIDVVPADTTA